MKLLTKHEISYIHSLAKSKFHLIRESPARNPEDIVKVLANKKNVKIKYGGFYGEDTARRTFYEGKDYALLDPKLYKVREGFYSVGWEYQVL